jgi:hypothetical protein
MTAGALLAVPHCRRRLPPWLLPWAAHVTLFDCCHAWCDSLMQAAAAMAIGVGSFCDPPEMQGTTWSTCMHGSLLHMLV